MWGEKETNYYGAQNDYTHIFIIWELIFQLHRTSVTQGFLAGILLCNSGAFLGTFCERANYTHSLSGNYLFNYTHLLRKRIVSELFVQSSRAS